MEEIVLKDEDHDILAYQMATEQPVPLTSA